MAHFLDGSLVYLREVREEDVDDSYYKWMNDPEINQYMETRFYPQGKTCILQYVQEHANKPMEPWFAICLQKDDRHIGNVKLGPINFYHRTADISYFIGEKECWGRGYATEAIGLVVRYAFDTLGLYKLNAGTYAGNMGSQTVLKKNHFQQEAHFRKEAICTKNGICQREDVFRFGLLREDY